MTRLPLLLSLPLLATLTACGGGQKGDPCTRDAECALAYECSSAFDGQEGICVVPGTSVETDDDATA